MLSKVSQWWRAKIAAAIAKNPGEDPESISKAGTWLYARTMGSACCELLGVSYPCTAPEYDEALKSFFDDLYDLAAHEQSVLLKCCCDCKERGSYAGKDAAAFPDELRAGIDELVASAGGFPSEMAKDAFMGAESRKQVLYEILELKEGCSKDEWSAALSEKLFRKDSKYHILLGQIAERYAQTTLFPPIAEPEPPAGQDSNSVAAKTVPQPVAANVSTSSPSPSPSPQSGASLQATQTSTSPQPLPAVIATPFMLGNDSPVAAVSAPVCEAATSVPTVLAAEPDSRSVPASQPEPSFRQPAFPNGEPAKELVEQAQRYYDLYLGRTSSMTGIPLDVTMASHLFRVDAFCKLIGCPFPTTPKIFDERLESVFGKDGRDLSRVYDLIRRVGVYYSLTWRVGGEEAERLPNDSWRETISELIENPSLMDKPIYAAAFLRKRGVGISELMGLGNWDEEPDASEWARDIRREWSSHCAGPYGQAVLSLADIVEDDAATIWHHTGDVPRQRERQYRTRDADGNPIRETPADRPAKARGESRLKKGVLALADFAFAEMTEEARKQARSGETASAATAAAGTIESTEDKGHADGVSAGGGAGRPADGFAGVRELARDYEPDIRDLLPVSRVNALHGPVYDAGRFFKDKCDKDPMKVQALMLAGLREYGPYATSDGVELEFYSNPLYLFDGVDEGPLITNAETRRMRGVRDKGLEKEEAVARTISALRHMHLDDDEISEVLKEHPEDYKVPFGLLASCISDGKKLLFDPFA